MVENKVKARKTSGVKSSKSQFCTTLKKFASNCTIRAYLISSIIACFILFITIRVIYPVIVYQVLSTIFYFTYRFVFSNCFSTIEGLQNK